MIIDYLEGTYSIIGIIDYFVAFAFPYQIGPQKLYLQPTDGTGDFQVSVQIRDVSQDVILARKDDQSIVLHDKREKKTFILNVPPFELPREGQYEVRGLADGQMIDTQTFYAYIYREDHDAEDKDERGE